MRNATMEDVKKAQRTGELEENVMYQTLAGTLVHGKRQSNTVKQVVGRFNNKVVLCETVEGVIWCVDPFSLIPVEKGPATTPKKPRRKPTKGTKPFKEVPFDKSLLKAGSGMRVKFRCDKIAKIYESKKGALVVEGLSIANWYDSGKYYFNNNKWDIISILIPHEEQKQNNTQPTPSQSDIDKQNFERGLWVPFVATNSSVRPEWIREDQLVKVMLRDGFTGIYKATDFPWGTELSVNYHVMAFKKP